MFKFRLILSTLILYAYAGLQIIKGQELYGNEWISNNQEYYKISVIQEGIYRLSYQELESTGVPVNQLDPRKLKLYLRGREVAVNFFGQLDARFDPGDYLEFYARPNDGVLDQEMYVVPEAQPHQHVNLFCDTAYYFLTWARDASFGKRMSNFFENNVQGIPAQQYQLNIQKQVFASNYSKGIQYPEGTEGNIWLSQYDYGEGWTGPAIRKGNFQDIWIDSLDQIYQQGPAPSIELMLSGRNGRSHKSEIFVGPDPANLRLLQTAEFKFYRNYQLNQSLSWADLDPEGKLLIRVKSTGYEDNIPDFISVAYLKLEVAMKPVFNGGFHKFKISENNGQRIYYNFPASKANRIMNIQDPWNPEIIGFNQSAGQINFMLPSGSELPTLAITDSIYAVTGIQKINLRRTQPGTIDYLIISHPELRRSAAGYDDPVKSYAQYRSSPEGGNYQVKIFDIDDLYNEFTYGEITPLAIRRMAGYMIKNNKARFMLLIGKGMDVSLNYFRRPASDFWYPNFIPAYGEPGSDQAFTANLNGNGSEAAVATGRISTTRPAQVAAYLNKVKEMESLGYEALWRKELVHLSGGFTAAENLIFKSYIDGFKNLAENRFLGGKCLNISKKTNNSVELINISEEVNQGKVMITFFGHSGSNNSDIDIGYISSAEMGYHNKGKYPLLLVNGCNAGSIYGNTLTFGEDWMMHPDKGSIGVIAHSAFGYSRSLKRYSDMFYQVGFGDSAYIHQPVGIIHQEVARRFIESFGQTPENISQVQQMVYQGDPAYCLFGTRKPDYEINENGVFIAAKDQEHLTAFSDSLKLKLLIRNFGIVGPDSLSVSVERIREDGTTASYGPFFYPGTFYQDTISIQIPLGTRNDFGNNQFTFKLDALDSIHEINEMNNTARFEYYIPLRGSFNLYPSGFSIINQPDLNLVVQSTDLLDQQRDFLIELDTSSSFDSPFKMQWQVSGKVLASQSLTLPFTTDTTAYYWRSRFAQPIEGEDDSWFVSSFTYIPDGPLGWIQADHEQFIMNNKEGLVISPTDWQFKETETSIRIVTYGADHPELDYSDVEVYINGLSYVFSTRLCSNNSLNLIAFDESSTVPYLGLNFGGWDLYDRRSCGRRPQVINSFIKDDLENPARDYLTRFIDNIPDGDYVAIFTSGEVAFESWPQHLWEKLRELGADESIKDLINGEPLILLGKKNTPGGLIKLMRAEVGQNLREQRIEISDVIHGKFNSGYLMTDKIGPAGHWQSFIFRNASMDVFDSKGVDIYKVSLEGESILWQENVNSPDLDLTAVNARDYPYLQLKYKTSDKINFSPAELKLWEVTYDPVPEGILVKINEDAEIQLQEGEEKVVQFKFDNISNLPFTDSIQVSFTIYNHDSHQKKVLNQLIAPLPPHQHQIFDVVLPTIDMTGSNDLQVYVNPRILPEQSYNNNLIDFKNFYQVKPDLINPVLDVTFDGIHIMDGDIVSPSPAIRVLLKDENRFMYKADTTSMQMLIKRNCEGCSFQPVNFSSPAVSYRSASAEEDFLVEYQPESLENGLYTLQVQASDVSGNKAATAPYEITFEVINESSITNFYPYPNPFSSSTRFVFTLTGAEIPDKLRIQIMTISGKVVREINQEELGPVKIGHNISRFAWDGKDEFGDQLANGVYFYKVQVTTEGEERISKRETPGDRGFKHNIGKLYLLR